MVKSRDVREIALSHYESGKKAPEIATLLANKVHRTTVHRWIHQYQQSGSIDVKQKSGRPKTGRTKRLINLVKKGLVPTFLEKVCEQWLKTLKAIPEPSNEY